MTDKEEFTKKIINIQKNDELNTIDSIIIFCEQHDIQIEDIIHNIDDNLKSRILTDAMNLNYIKKCSTLHKFITSNGT